MQQEIMLYLFACPIRMQCLATSCSQQCFTGGECRKIVDRSLLKCLPVETEKGKSTIFLAMAWYVGARLASCLADILPEPAIFSLS